MTMRVITLATRFASSVKTDAGLFSCIPKSFYQHGNATMSFCILVNVSLGGLRVISCLLLAVAKLLNQKETPLTRQPQLPRCKETTACCHVLILWLLPSFHASHEARQKKRDQLATSICICNLCTQIAPVNSARADRVVTSNCIKVTNPDAPEYAFHVVRQQSQHR